ncbi:MAG: carbohydrate ABC transporter permease [Spirochaetia bacterium]|jgi:multiple sugar transport system permease protein|nr:carbohydrate ABC transporter permease [Spirochaetia bacterium]
MYLRKRKSRTIAIAVALLLAVVSLFPYYYILLQSFTPWAEVDTSMVPHHLVADSYSYLMTNGGADNRLMWIRSMFNSVFVSTVSTGIALVTGLLIAYAMTKIRFSGGKAIYDILLFQMFFPTIILLVPQYMLLRPLVNNYLGMIIPFTISAWAILMYYNYFKTLSSSIFESARIDGASEVRIAFTIAFPICKTISIIVFLSIFLGRWSELMWDMLMAPKLQMQTLNVLITTQFKPMGNLPGPLYAASVILTFPVLILFLAFSKYFKQGIAMQFK